MQYYENLPALTADEMLVLARAKQELKEASGTRTICISLITLKHALLLDRLPPRERTSALGLSSGWLSEINKMIKIRGKLLIAGMNPSKLTLPDERVFSARSAASRNLPSADLIAGIRAVIQAADRHNRLVEVYVQLIKNADALFDVSAIGLAAALGLSRGYAEEIRRCRALAPHLVSAGLMVERLQ